MQKTCKSNEISDNHFETLPRSGGSTKTYQEHCEDGVLPMPESSVDLDVEDVVPLYEFEQHMRFPIMPESPFAPQDVDEDFIAGLPDLVGGAEQQAYPNTEHYFSFPDIFVAGEDVAVDECFDQDPTIAMIVAGFEKSLPPAVGAFGSDFISDFIGQESSDPDKDADLKETFVTAYVVADKV